jgi:hypothetical protein
MGCRSSPPLQPGGLGIWSWTMVLCSCARSSQIMENQKRLTPWDIFFVFPFPLNAFSCRNSNESPFLGFIYNWIGYVPITSYLDIPRPRTLVLAQLPPFGHVGMVIEGRIQTVEIFDNQVWSFWTEESQVRLVVSIRDTRSEKSIVVWFSRCVSVQSMVVL